LDEYGQVALSIEQLLDFVNIGGLHGWARIITPTIVNLEKFTELGAVSTSGSRTPQFKNS
jgi:hypothetical protein